MDHTSDKSETEIEIEEALKETEEIIDDSYLTTKAARKILDKIYKLLPMCKRLRESRDNWRNKFETLKETSEATHNFIEDVNPMEDVHSPVDDPCGFDVVDTECERSLIAVVGRP